MESPELGLIVHAAPEGQEVTHCNIRLLDRRLVRLSIFNKYKASALIGELCLLSLPDREAYLLGLGVRVHCKPTIAILNGGCYEHPVFGTGTVLALRNNVVELDFGDVGIKRLDLGKAKEILRPSTEQS